MGVHLNGVWTAGVQSRLPHCWLQDGEAWQLCALCPHLGSGDNATSPTGSLCRVDNSQVHEVLGSCRCVPSLWAPEDE